MKVDTNYTSRGGVWHQQHLLDFLPPLNVRPCPLLNVFDFLFNFFLTKDYNIFYVVYTIKLQLG